MVTFNQLPPLPNARSHSASLNTTVTYQCEEGYVSDGVKATSTCLESGTWSYPSLYCSMKVILCNCNVSFVSLQENNVHFLRSNTKSYCLGQTSGIWRLSMPVLMAQCRGIK